MTSIPVLDRGVLPPVVYIPVSADPDDRGPRYTMVRVDDERQGFPVYTALDRLQLALGPEQAWMWIEMRDVEQLHQRGMFDIVVVDQGAPNPAPDDFFQQSAKGA